MKVGNRSLKIQYSKAPAFLYALLFTGACSFNMQLTAQTPIQGIVNHYYPVTDIIYSRACVRVPDPTGLAQDDKVMLIQMKGATINTDPGSSAFGDTISLNNAGNYEIGTVCHVKDDSVFLVFMLLNSYTVSGKVQLVRIPHYENAEVVDTLKPAPWNDATGTGGVLAIDVQNDLVLNSHIFADSSGFKGGAYRLSGDLCSNISPASAYAYNANVFDPSTQNGAFKGEAIAIYPAAISGGRGAPANGGGGGNNHNNGGGGGSNVSSGGDGGGNSSSMGCQVAIPGHGAKVLSNHGGTKIFAGGGGGAGHVNNGTTNAYGGGNGGGIVFINTTNIISNNRRISANGQVGGRTSGDGASGGGGGGTVIINADNYAGVLTVQANGGNGGIADNGLINGRCYGSGGGGGGGAIYFSGGVPPATVSVNGGNAGAENRRTVTCNPAVPAAAGSLGQIFPNYTFASSLILESSYCALLLPINLVSFKATGFEEQVRLNWEILADEPGVCTIERSIDGRDWINIGRIELTEKQNHYELIDHQPRPGQNFYRVKLEDKAGSITYSSVQRIYIAGTKESFRVYPNPAYKKIVLVGQPGSAFISLYDMSGKLVWKKAIASTQLFTELSLPDLSKGIYLLRSGNIIKKLVIQ